MRRSTDDGSPNCRHEFVRTYLRNHDLDDSSQQQVEVGVTVIIRSASTSPQNDGMIVPLGDVCHITACITPASEAER